MEIIIIRHAQPEWVKDGLNVVNPPLTSLGFEQSQLLAESLRDSSFDEVFVSPLLRAKQTAAPVLQVLQKQEVIADWLEEIRDPMWHGTPEERAQEAWKAEKQKHSHERWLGLDGGENVSDFVSRINDGTARFLEEQGLRRTDNSLPVWVESDTYQHGKKIVLICHAGTGSVAICHMLGLQPTPWEWERFVIGHATINVISALKLGDGITFGLKTLSGNDHLPDHMRTY
ncbi:MAG: histidine phosphatase family protein [Ilumatobacteraceae bacterium]